MYRDERGPAVVDHILEPDPPDKHGPDGKRTKDVGLTTSHANNRTRGPNHAIRGRNFQRHGTSLDLAQRRGNHTGGQERPLDSVWDRLNGPDAKVGP